MEENEISVNNAGGGQSPSLNNKNRDFAIDIIRLFAIFLIILAHVSNVPEWLANIRRFDVPVMVFISGISFSYSKPIETKKDYFRYIWKRIKKLIFTAWIFITIYLLYMIILKFCGYEMDLSFKNILFSYTFLGGVGYVWILRILFCMAILAPLVKLLLDKFNNEWITILAAILLIGLNTGLVYVDGLYQIKYFTFLYETVFLPILGYLPIYMIGMRLRKFNFKQNLTLIISLAVLLTISILWLGFDLQAQKYPPHLGYITYGLLVGTCLYLILNKLNLKRNFVINWLSKESFLIYFIHTFAILTITTLNLNLNWALAYLIVLVFSIVVAIGISFAKEYISKIIDKRKLNN